MLIAQAKSDLRRHLRAARAALDPAQRRAEQQHIVAALQRLIAAQAPADLASTCALPDEVDLDALHQWWWRLGKPVWLPRVSGPGQVTWHAVSDPAHLQPGFRGIREPDPALAPAQALPPRALLIVPGVGFSSDGARLGQGGGFYDRVLAHHSGPSVGVAFACQRVGQVPAEPHDRPVGQVIFGD